MTMRIEIEIQNHQREVELSDGQLALLEVAARDAWTEAQDLKLPENSLAGLESLDIAMVDREESDRVHREFMNIEGATDVITFHHGELLICPDVARMQAVEFGEPVLRELLRYVVHGILHLAGYLDADREDRQRMELVQERVVRLLWDRHFEREMGVK